MSQARTMFDLEKHGEEQLNTAILRLPPGAMLILDKSGLAISATRGGARRFQLRLSPRLKERPDIDWNAFKAASTATDELVRVHNAVVKDQQSNEE